MCTYGIFVELILWCASRVLYTLRTTLALVWRECQNSTTISACSFFCNSFNMFDILNIQFLSPCELRAVVSAFVQSLPFLFIFSFQDSSWSEEKKFKLWPFCFFLFYWRDSSQPNTKKETFNDLMAAKSDGLREESKMQKMRHTEKKYCNLQPT